MYYIILLYRINVIIIVYVFIFIHKGEIMAENYEKAYNKMYKKYLNKNFLKNKSFEDVIKPVFKNTFECFGKSAIAFKITSDILHNIKKYPEIYSNYNLKERKKLDELIKICSFNINSINSTMDDIINCFEI